MAVRIDAAAGLVEAEEARFPLTLDCRDGTARLRCGEAVFVLRPIRWREKANLARFAHLGAAFLEEAFLRLSLIGEPPLPDDAKARQALSRLAEWLNAPGRERPLPLNPLLLARASAALCRGLGLRPQDLDDLPAGEVEALWIAIDGIEEHSAPPNVPGRRSAPAGFTHRIEILPDRSDRMEKSAGNRAPASDMSANRMPDLIPAAGAPAGLTAAPAPSPTPDRPAGEGPASAWPARPRPKTSTATGTELMPPRRDNCSGERPRFRVVTSLPPSPAPISAPSPAPVSAEVSPPSSVAVPPSPLSAETNIEMAEWAERAAPAMSAVAPHRPEDAKRSAVSTPAAIGAAEAVAPAAPASTAADVESLLDIFAARLAEAATLLGIDEV